MYGAVLVVWGLALSGCLAPTGMARTLDPGELQLSVSPGASSNPGTDVLPHLEVGARYGLAEKVDVGAKLTTWAVQGDIRLALQRSPTLESGLDLTLAPSVGYAFSSPGLNRFMLTLPLLLGVNMGGSQLVLGPRVLYLFPDNFPSSPARLAVGTSLGAAFPMGGSFRLVPEVTLLFDTSPQPESVSSGALVSLGMLWGGYK